MVFFNYALRKLNAKIVYYGPGLCGKTTNLQWIHDHFEGGQRGKMISLSTEGDRTIFFDLLPLDIGSIRGMDVTLQLYTVPGQVHYNSTRQLVLRGADGVVFVADSQATMRSSNVESLRNLEENLSLQGVELDDFPHVLQFNKRDLGDLIDIEDLDADLNQHSVPIFEAVATEGVGVQETLEGIVKLVMRNLRERYEPVVAAGPKAPEGEGRPLDVEVPAAVPFVPPTRAADQPGDAPSMAAQPPPEPIGIQDDVPTQVYQDGRPSEDEEDDRGFSGDVTWDGADEVPGPTFGEDMSPGGTDRPTDSGTYGFAMPFADNETTTDVTDIPEKDDNEITAEQLTDTVHDIEPEEGSAIDFGEPPEGMRESPFEVADLTPEPYSPGAVFGDPDGERVGDEAASEAPDETEPEDLGWGQTGGDQTTIGEEVGSGVADEPMAAGTVDDLVASVLNGEEGSEREVEEEFVEETFEIEDDFDAADHGSIDAGEGDDAGLEPSINDLEPTIEGADEDLSAGEENSTWGDEVAEPDSPSPDMAEAGSDDEAFDGQPDHETESGGVADAAAESGFEPPPVEHGEPDFAPVADFVPEEPPEEEPDFTPVDEFAPVEGSEEHEGDTAAAGSPEARADDTETPIDTPWTERNTNEYEVEAEAVVDESATDVSDVVSGDEPATENVDIDEEVQAVEEHEPITLGMGDPFGDEADEQQTPVRAAVEPRVEVPPTVTTDGLVRAEDNQLHLRLQGTGAIAESGQVRALDIEVPVPGSWVGNRRVTLQLRLTLSPVSEDDDGGQGEAP